MAGPAYQGVALNRIRDKGTRDALRHMDLVLRGLSKGMAAGTSDAPATGLPAEPYVVISASTNLSAERVLAVSAPITRADGGPNSTVTIGASLATPAFVFGTAAAAGSAASLVRSDATLAIFDATDPAPLAGTAAPGSAAFAARRDHVHIFPTTLQSTANAATFTATDDGNDLTLRGEPPGAFRNLILSAPMRMIFDVDSAIYRFLDSAGSIGMNIVLAPSGGVGGMVAVTSPNLTNATASPIDGFFLAITRANTSGGGNFYGYHSLAAYNATTGSTTGKEFFASRFRTTGSASNTLGNNANDIAGGILLVNDFTVAAGQTLANYYSGGLVQSFPTVNGTLTNHYGWRVPDMGVGTNRWAFSSEVDDCSFGGQVAIGTETLAAQTHIDQNDAAAAIPVLALDQGDIDDTFINFIGTSAADGTRSISSDTTEDSAKFGAIRVEINGVTKWIRVYDDES